MVTHAHSGRTSRETRDSVIPLPGRDDGYSRVLLVGTTGAGKTTLLRHLIGSDPNRDRFPSTSTAKTTIAEIEIVTAPGPYRAVVTFASQEQVQDDVRDCIDAASKVVVTDPRASDSTIAHALLEHAEQRFRMSYILGGWNQSLPSSEADSEDEYGEEDESVAPLPIEEVVGADETVRNNLQLQEFIGAIRDLALAARRHAAAEYDDYANLKTPNERDEWLDELFEPALRSLDEYSELLDDIMTAIEHRFTLVSSGHFDDVSDLRLHWPTHWTFESQDRAEFLAQVRWFSSNHHQQFGRLLTPIVDGVRVQGPLFPSRGELQAEDSRLVLIDGEGLGHSSREAGSISTKITSRFDDTDLILLVDSAAQPLQLAPLNLLDTAGNSGHGAKLAVAFTHFDQVKGDNLRNRPQKIEHVGASIVNALSSLRERLAPRVSETLEARLSTHAFYLGALNRTASRLPGNDVSVLKSLMDVMRSSGQLQSAGSLMPTYDFDSLDDLALNDATEGFKDLWKGRLGLALQPDVGKEHWARIKALCRRLAHFGRNEYNDLRPVAELIREMQTVVSDWLEEPDGWRGRGTAEDEKAVIDKVRRATFQRIHAYAEQQVAEARMAEWEDAYSLRGRGSTFERARLMFGRIIEPAAPRIQSRARRDTAAEEFRDEIKRMLREAVEEVEDAQEELVKMRDAPHLVPE